MGPKKDSESIKAKRNNNRGEKRDHVNDIVSLGKNTGLELTMKKWRN